mmetsp:Transcript_42698/g.134532  ORF Transcript_42698/g.134532 Transcript_42698/m.134532 type:complete len:237 (+) Transcript_42698:1532-2242(+)
MGEWKARAGREEECTLGYLDADNNISFLVIVDVKVPLAIVANSWSAIFFHKRPILVVILFGRLHRVLLPLHRLLLLVFPLLLLHLPLVICQPNLWAEPIQLLPLLVRVDLLVRNLLCVHKIRISSHLLHALPRSGHQSHPNVSQLLLCLNPLRRSDRMPVQLLELWQRPDDVEPVGLELRARVPDEEQFAQVVVHPQALNRQEVLNIDEVDGQVKFPQLFVPVQSLNLLDVVQRQV